jgi:thiosulfate reductase cytochrome b subunit
MGRSLFGLLSVVGAAAWLVSRHFIAAWIFMVFGLAYCISVIGPQIDHWSAMRARRDKPPE